MEFATAKTADETWVQYVDRLVERGYLTEEDQLKWKSGKALRVTRKVSVTRFGAALRIRQIKKGKKQIEKEYAVAIPINEKVKGKLRIPKPGVHTEDALCVGFLNEDGEKILTRSNEPTPKELRQLQRELKRASLKFVSRKSEDETWRSYVDRLVSEQLISKAERKRWLAGHTVTVSKNIVETVMHPRTQIRAVSGKSKKKKRVSVEVPVSRTVTLTLTLPALGKLADDVKRKGFS